LTGTRSARNRALYPLLAVNFVGTLGLGIVLPFLIFLVTGFGGNAVIYGIFGATYSAFQMIGAPILGRWSDRFGRRKILLLSHLGTLVSWLIFYFALYLPVIDLSNIDSVLLGSFTLTLPLLILFVARIFDGLTGGNISVANAYLADITDDKNRSKNFGKMAVASNLGYIAGPALAGILGTTDMAEKLPILAAILISVVTSIIIIYLLPESPALAIQKNPERMNVRKILAQEQKECFKIECKQKITFRDVLKMRMTALILAIYFFVYLGFNFFYIAFPVHAVKALNWDLTETGFFFSFLSVIMVIIQGPVLQYLSKHWEDPVLVCAGSFILGASFLFFTSQATLLVYAGAAALAIGNGVMWPSLLSILSKSAPERFQGAIQGYAGSLGSAASIIGLLTGGILYNIINTGVFVFSAAIIFLIFIFSFRLLSAKALSAADA
jgi:DHA1 family tetracycline resistance protein-like MFS transporter